MRYGLSVLIWMTLIAPGAWAADGDPAVAATAAVSRAPTARAAAIAATNAPVKPSTNAVAKPSGLPAVATNLPPAQPEAPGPRLRLALTDIERFVALALECVHREYPNKVAHVLQGDADALPPRRLTPAFYGCYDWHSAVHGHWLLARAARLFPDAAFAEKARTALAKSLTPENIAGEQRYIRGPGRTAFERPYGLAWLLQLCAELREWEDPRARSWAAILAPLESEAVARLRDWLPKLTQPIRVGEHSQTAFALALALDWAKVAGDDAFGTLLRERALEFFAGDREAPLDYEPSGEDFLSPCLGEADLMRRVLPAGRFAVWLAAFLPEIPVTESADWLVPLVVSDPSDPKLAHLDGLNLSRAWMLEGIASALAVDDGRREALLAAARLHRDLGLRSVTGAHYEGGHWLGTFALYLVSQRGLPAARPSSTGGEPAPGVTAP